MKVLNLYAGIGGNRKLWTDCEVTAVELNPEIAKIYQDFFPNDTVIVADAHEYLLEHFKEYDFIWSSPPCPTHSRIRNEAGIGSGQNKPVYPSMVLYEEIILMNHLSKLNSEAAGFKGRFVIENVISYYPPLIPPQVIGLHYFWANFLIPEYEIKTRNHWNLTELKKTKFDINNKTLLRNCTEPELGLHIFNCAKGIYQHSKDVNQLALI